jgi:hypothetical protein
MTTTDAVHWFCRRKQLLKMSPEEIAALLVKSATEHGENNDGPSDLINDLSAVISILYSALPATGSKRGAVLLRLQEHFWEIPEYTPLLEG